MLPQKVVQGMYYRVQCSMYNVYALLCTIIIIILFLFSVFIPLNLNVDCNSLTFGLIMQRHRCRLFRKSFPLQVHYQQPSFITSMWIHEFRTLWLDWIDMKFHQLNNILWTKCVFKFSRFELPGMKCISCFERHCFRQRSFHFPFLFLFNFFLCNFK